MQKAWEIVIGVCARKFFSSKNTGLLFIIKYRELCNHPCFSSALAAKISEVIGISFPVPGRFSSSFLYLFVNIF